ncbi:MAG: 50S ribosomal protein L4, partial [Candidatus Altiarchaeales archaeon]|nr:50S ribosomal protein L4 [Candidatus Altiarchaeales archaeon]
NRGHLIDDVKNIPLIVEDKFQKLDKTTDVLNTLKHLGLEDELDRAREKKIRAGKGKTRGRKYKKRKSVLIVVNEDHGIKKGSRNIPGVDIVDLNELNVELLAPGAHAGRLSLWTKSAIKNLDALIAS